MRFVIQRVTCASVTIDGVKTAEIGRGFLVLAGVFEEVYKLYQIMYNLKK